MTPTILFVSLSTSLDRYLWVDSLRLGSINRPTRVVEAAGGKALNAARAASRLGCGAWVVGLIGGRSGRSIEALAAGEPWTARWIRSEAESKVSTCILDEGEGVLTEFYEPTSCIAEVTAWSEVLGAVDDVFRDVRVDGVVLSGRAPAGLPAGALAQLVELAHERGSRSYVDAAGESLVAAFRARPYVVKVNEAEAAEATGLATGTLHDSIAAAERIVSLGAEVAIVTRGADGAVLVGSGGERFRVEVPAVTSALAVGGGDTFMGALVTARESGEQWSAVLAYAAASALVSVGHLEAAVVDTQQVLHVLDRIHVSAI